MVEGAGRNREPRDRRKVPGQQSVEPVGHQRVVGDNADQHRAADTLSLAPHVDDLASVRHSDFYIADLVGASAIGMEDGHLDITIWKPGEPVRVVRKT
jgi:hypothetical protein